MYIDKVAKEYFSVELFDAGYTVESSGHGQWMYKLIRFLTFNKLIIYCMDITIDKSFWLGYASGEYDGCTHHCLALGCITIRWLGHPDVRKTDNIWKMEKT